MCPYTLDHNKMLASTMQHSTHNHTPTLQPPPQPRPTNRATDRVRPARPGAVPRTTSQGVFSGPNSVRARRRPPPQTWHHPAMLGTSAVEVFHPATPTGPSRTGVHCMIRCGISERRDTHPSGVHEPTSPNGETP